MFFIFSCILLHLASLTIAQTDLLYKNCPNDVGNYTTNSDFQRNLNSALSSLDSNTQIDYGFYNLSVGQPGPDQANVIALCRGDIGADECQNCIGNSSAKILQDCPKQKEAFGIADTCILRYSNKSIFGAMEDSPESILVNTGNATDVNQFNQGLQTLMTRLRSTAASGDSFRKFATGNETAGFDIIFGLVQCTPDLSELQCDNCLAGVIRVIGRQLVGRQGSRITTPSCNLRYEINLFFGVTPAINSNCTNNSYCTNSARTNADFMQDADFMQEAITAKTWNEESMQERISCNSKGNMLDNDNSLRQQNPHDNEEPLNHGMKIVSNGNNNTEEENPADDI